MTKEEPIGDKTQKIEVMTDVVLPFKDFMHANEDKPSAACHKKGFISGNPPDFILHAAI